MIVDALGERVAISLEGIDLSGPVAYIGDEILDRLAEHFSDADDTEYLELSDLAQELACEVAK